LGALYSVISAQNISAILPPLERVCSLAIILLIGWAFFTAEDERWGRAANVVLLLLLLTNLVAYIVTGIQWTNQTDNTNFNLSVYGVAWTFSTFIVSIFGLILVAVSFKRVTDAPLKLLFFALLILGYGGTLLQINQLSILGNYAGTVRLALFAALAILPVLVYRMVMHRLQSELKSQEQITARNNVVPMDTRTKDSTTGTNVTTPLSTSLSPIVSPAQRDSIQLLKILGLILEDAAPSSIPEKIITAVLDSLKADIGAILTLQDANYADLANAYDKSMKRRIAGMSINLDNQPTLVNAIERRSQRPLYTDRNTNELRDLYNRLDIEQTGPAYFQPLTRGKDLVGVLLVAMPYSQRELDESERELLKGIGIISGNLLGLSYAARDAGLKAEERAIQALVQGIPLDELHDDSVLAARQEMQSNLQASREQINDLTHQISQLKLELDAERNRITTSLGDTEEGMSVSQRILTLTDEQHNLRSEREQLLARLQEAETALAGATASSNESVYKHMVEVLRREKEDLIGQRNTLQTQIAQMRAADQQINPTVAMETVAERINVDNSRMQAEREELQGKLSDISAQLQALGIEQSTSGMAQLITQLIEQRTGLQQRIDALALERNALLNERVQHEDSIKREKERASRIQALETEMRNLASDREALTVERDQIRTERDELKSKQDSIKQNRARLLAEASGYQLELAEAHQEQAKLRLQLQVLSNEKSDLTSRQNHLLAEKQALQAERDALLATSGNLPSGMKSNGDANIASLTAMIDDLSVQRNQLERELNETRSALGEAQNRISALKVTTERQPTTDEVEDGQKQSPELTLEVIQEFRTPLSSIMGYIDLLMDESAGILGEMQRKFLQRVAANITRLSSITDDLTRITAMDSSRLVLVPRPVNIVNIIEDTISNSTYQFREKGLTVNLNLDDNLPTIEADQDAISQVIGQILTNAYLVSPPDSQIIITAHRQDVKLSTNGNLASPTDCVLVSVEDRGGGIPPEELARVFARKYKAENPVINGLGDSGVALSIAKMLIEAHGGGLWVETRPSIGSIFYFALPITSMLEAEG
jgi:signal transduction histidine kinase